MEKEDLEIRKVSEELTAEDLGNVNGGAIEKGCSVDCQKVCDSPKKCSCD